MPNPTTDAPRWIDVRGLRTAYRREGSGAPMLYLHGAGLTRRWLPIHAALAGRFDLIAPEHPGFGDTPRPRWYRSIDDMALHYADLLDGLGLDRVHVVGHSFGGRVAASFAAIFPERVLSLSLLAPAPLEPGGDSVAPPWADEEIDLDELMFVGNKADYPDYLDGDDEGEIVAPDDGDPHADPATWTLDTDPALYRRLARLSAPTAVVIPDDDRLIPRELFDEWVTYLPGAQLVQVSGEGNPTGHLFIVQEPEAIARAVTQVAQTSRSAG